MIIDMKSILSRFLVICVWVFPFSALADNEGFCQKAQTTADLVSCTTKHLDAENAHLKALYDELVTGYRDDTARLSVFNGRQAAWITLRADTCAYEAEAYKGGSLERVQELSCLARMTSDRADHFAALLTTMDDKKVPVFSSPPRWVNVIIDDYKDIFWQFGSEQSLDTDCDGVDEMLVKGVSLDSEGQYHAVTAIADHDKTGRPGVTLLRFDDQKNCEILPDVKIIPAPLRKPSDTTDANAGKCTKHVMLQTKNCGDFVLSLDQGSDSYTVSAFEETKKE